MEIAKPKTRRLNLVKPAAYPNHLLYSEENANKPKYWCQSGVKNYSSEYDKQYRKNYEKNQQQNEPSSSYVAPLFDKHLYFGLDYVVLCRFHMNYNTDYSKFNKKPIIELECLKRFMNTYISETTLQTLDNQIYSSKNGFSKINEYVIRGLVNIALNIGGHKSIAENENLKEICQYPPYNLACLLINPDDDYHKKHQYGSQRIIYNALCSRSYYTKPAAKQELGEERGFYIMQLGQTFYLISHEICIKELPPEAANCETEFENNAANLDPNFLSFDNIAGMYTGLIKGFKLVKTVNYNNSANYTNTEFQKNTEKNEIIYNIVWSNFYLTEVTKDVAGYIMTNITSYQTFIKGIRDEGHYINYTAIKPRQKIIFDIVTMFCDGLAVGFETKNMK